MFLCWRYGNEDPWRTYNRLDEAYRPLWAPELPPLRPRWPDRLQNWMYACGIAAAIMEQKMKDQRPSVTQRPRREADGVRAGLLLPTGVKDPRG